MGLSRAGDDLSASFVPDDKERRQEFDRRLAGYVRRHRERWDITAVLGAAPVSRRKDRAG